MILKNYIGLKMKAEIDQSAYFSSYNYLSKNSYRRYCDFDASIIK